MMKVEIHSKNADCDYINYFKSLVEKIDPPIKKLMKEFGFAFALYDNCFDIKTKEQIEALDKEYKYNVGTNNAARGNFMDNGAGGFLVLIFHDTVKEEHIEAILYHEIGHFLDFYFCFIDKNFTFSDINSKLNMKKALSRTPEFAKAYKKDLVENWNLIKNDSNYRLKHFIQDATPVPWKKPSDLVLAETFAELYRYRRGLKNDTETVEIYFPRAKIVQDEIFKKLNWYFGCI